jgi:catabolite regulation protein CreA
LIIGGFEDKIVRIFDKSKMTFAFKAHEDSVTSIATTANMN